MPRCVGANGEDRWRSSVVALALESGHAIALESGPAIAIGEVVQKRSL